MIYEIDILNDEMVLFDENGSSFESAALTTYGEAIRTVRRWLKHYPIKIGNAYQLIARHFATK
jgi:hypothetical protein